MTEVTNAMARLDALLAPQGRELLDRLACEQVTAETALRLGATLRKQYPAELVAAALAQHELRLAAREKFTEAMRMFFTRCGLEQASSEMTARYRARRYGSASRVADLCTGVGGDLIALAESRSALAVDHDRLHLRMAQLNSEVYDVADGVHAVLGDVREVSLTGIDAVFIDPARRARGRRLRAGHSEPPLEWCVGVADRVPAVGIKTAPGITQKDIPTGWEIEFVAIGRDLKEAVLWSPALACAARRATILPAEHTMGPSEGPPVEAKEPGAFLLDPNPAITRAGLVQELARELGAWKIDEQIAFLSTNTEIHTPFARTLRVAASVPWHLKHLTKQLRALDIGTVDIRRRGLAGNVDDLARRLKLHGTRRATLVMTRTHNRPWALICFDPNQTDID